MSAPTPPDCRHRGDCWLWGASKTHNGYGRFTVKGKTVRAHRWFYEQYFWPLHPDLTLDHLCRNRACVNPNHMEPVPLRVNLLRGEGFVGKNARKTHCPHGHPFAGENLFMEGSRRRCRACNNKRKLDYYYRRGKTLRDERRNQVGDTANRGRSV